MPVTRRQILAGAAGLCLRPSLGRAASPGLTVDTRVIEVLGRAATVYGISGPEGRNGLWARDGDGFPDTITNATGRDQLVHWHGQVLAPWNQDRTRPGGGTLAAGATDRFSFRLTPGTHWMHAHDLTEQQLLAAPMVCARADEVEPEATVMLHDFSFRPPEEILAGLGASKMHDMAAMGPMVHAGSDSGSQDGMGGMAMDGMAMQGGMMVHANDVAYDAYLANDRTLDDPQVIAVDPGPFRLRIINAATATAFWIDAGTLEARIVAVDGNPVAPLAANPVPMTQAQRLDLMLTIPPGGGAFPILAQVEGAVMRTGVILATPGARIERLAGTAALPAPLLDLSVETRLRAVSPLPQRQGRTMHLTLGMEPNYRWTINGKAHGEGQPLDAALNERVEIMFMNPTPMLHPMHLHGHHFQVVDLGQGRFAGAMRDVIAVPPGGMVTVAVDFDNAGDWFLHCHHLYHMAAGMMTSVRVGWAGAVLETYAPPPPPPDKGQ